jgi:hypothetical protein
MFWSDPKFFWGADPDPSLPNLHLFNLFTALKGRTNSFCKILLENCKVVKIILAGCCFLQVLDQYVKNGLPVCLEKGMAGH